MLTVTGGWDAVRPQYLACTVNGEKGQIVCMCLCCLSPSVFYLKLFEQVKELRPTRLNLPFKVHHGAGDHVKRAARICLLQRSAVVQEADPPS
jgi:hypothetical protein